MKRIFILSSMLLAVNGVFAQKYYSSAGATFIADGQLSLQHEQKVLTIAEDPSSTRANLFLNGAHIPGTFSGGNFYLKYDNGPFEIIADNAQIDFSRTVLIEYRESEILSTESAVLKTEFKLAKDLSTWAIIGQGVVDITVYSMAGQVVYSSKEQKVAGKYDLPELVKAAYIVVVRDKSRGSTLTQKIIY